MILGHYNYWIAIVLMMVGFYGILAKQNLVKQVIALSLFQTGVFLFYISMGVIDGGSAPVWMKAEDGVSKHPGPYDSTLPHVLMLTAIVVSVSVLAVALAIIVNIKRAYGTIEEIEIFEIDARRRDPQPLVDNDAVSSAQDGGGAR